MKHYLAIDHGEFKTIALILDEDGDIKKIRSDRDLYEHDDRNNYNWSARVERLINQLEIETNIDRGSFDIAFIALNGMNSSSDICIARLRAIELLGIHNIQIINDSVSAMRTGWLYDYKTPCVAAIYAGSGLNCCSRAKNGECHSLGWWRIASNDQGGYGIGRRIWNAVLDSYNKIGPKTLLTDHILAENNCWSIDQLINDFSSGKKRFYPEKFAHLLFIAAKMNDAVASSILEDISLRWLHYVNIVCEMVNANKTSGIDVFLTGGIFKCDLGLLEKSLIQRSQDDSRFNILKARYEPVIGVALLLLEKVYDGRIPYLIGQRINNSLLKQDSLK